MTGYSLKQSHAAPSTFAVFIFYLNETNEGRIHQHAPYVEKNNAPEARTGLPSTVFPNNRPSIASL